MTNFLPAGIITDSLSEIFQKLAVLSTQSAAAENDGLTEGLNEVKDKTLDLLLFLQNLSCQPLIYTGRGGTEEVIKRLDWALTFTEDNDAAELLKAYRKKQKKPNA
jgi:hypothetical protein